MSAQPVKLAVFASGAGSNARRLIEYFGTAAHPQGDRGIVVALVVSNKPEAGVLHIAADNQVPTLIIEKEAFFRGDAYVPALKAAGIDYIILAGFLWKVPSLLIQAYPQKMVNIHPALLPAYGGKGMYGNFVHEAVIAAKENKSGITIHFVDEQYDHGASIFQATCPVLPNDTPATLAQRIHELEHANYAPVIEQLLRKK
ncbi:phosphoribosylglycinamide formyltransferase [Deminuibacter soli]|uniref:Phosphoribosylglycinamide formyltransferase n=1 Tax=Deminuibacter soli TaxID=2291815 RepID=A0A3E1NQZ0_9BACT|nr:phosphoribosylglycinamide formyltransferase [Deminuibacter soli]RFM30369.1 phosphoribosylglycinamide formyltransferase [Deminuibacter soli]